VTVRDDRVPQPVEPGAPPEGGGHLASVLVVEDEPDLVWVIRFNLEMEGYRTLVASNGQAALDILRAEAEPPELMLLDLMMPIMDGWAVLEEIRREGWERPKVIVVSARTGAADRARATELEVNGFMSKPFDMDELLENVKSLVPPPVR
jgi:DNA-binding response OmpR family regulator